MIFNGFQHRVKITVFSTVVFTLFTTCAPGIDEVRNIPDITEMPTLSVKNMELLHSQHGRVRLKIKSQTVNLYSFKENSKTEFPHGIYVEFLSDDQTVISFLKANHAIYYEKEARWEATGNVEAMNSEGTIFNTEYIEWDERKGIIQSDKYIKVTDKDAIIVGTGFTAKQDFTDWKILRPTGILSVEQ